MEINISVSLDIPVHQKLTEGIKRRAKAAIFVLFVFNEYTSSKIFQEAFAAIKENKNVPAI